MYARAEDQKAYAAAYYAAHREQVAARVKAYHASHHKEYAERGKAYREKNREKVNAKSRAYNITHKEEHAAYYLTNKERLSAYQKAYRIAHRAEILAAQKLHHATHKEEATTRARKYKYGLSESQYETLLQKQGGVCAICKKSEWGRRGPHVDHDHATGKVRGIVCHYCNAALGMLRDNAETAQSIIHYLKGGTE